MSTELETNDITRGENEVGPTNDAVAAPERWSQKPSEAQDQLSVSAQRIAKKCRSGFLSENFDHPSDEKVPWSGSVTKVAAPKLRGPTEASEYDVMVKGAAPPPGVVMPRDVPFAPPGDPMSEEEATEAAREGRIKRLIHAMGGLGLLGGAMGALGHGLGDGLASRGRWAGAGAAMGAGLGLATQPLRQRNRREAGMAGFPMSSEGVAAHGDWDYIRELAEEVAHAHRDLYRDKQSSVVKEALFSKLKAGVGKAVSDIRAGAAAGKKARSDAGLTGRNPVTGMTRSESIKGLHDRGIHKPSLGTAAAAARTSPAGYSGTHPGKPGAGMAAAGSSIKTSAVKTGARWLLVKEAMGPSPF